MSENDNYNRSNVKRYTTQNFNIASISPNLKNHFEFLNKEADNDSYYANKIIGEISGEGIEIMFNGAEEDQGKKYYIKFTNQAKSKLYNKRAKDLKEKGKSLDEIGTKYIEDGLIESANKTMLLAAKYGNENAKKYCEAGEEIYKKLVVSEGKEVEIHDFKFSIV